MHKTAITQFAFFQKYTSNFFTTPATINIFPIFFAGTTRAGVMDTDFCSRPKFPKILA